MTSRHFAVRAEGSRPAIDLPTSTTFGGVTLTFAVGRLTASIVVGVVTGSAPSFDPAGELAASALVGACLMWLAPRLTGTPGQRTASLAALLFASIAAVMIEGTFFAPTLSRGAHLLVGMVLQLAVSLVTARVAVGSAASAGAGVLKTGRELPLLATRVAGATFVYVVAYFVTGAINYLLVTGPYYEAHAGGLTTPPPGVVFVVALTEGVLLTVGAIPLATTLTGSRRARALATGGALWVLGGLVPLLQAASLPDVIRVASTVEILLQKVPIGIAVAWLFAAAPIEAAGPQEPFRSRGMAAMSKTVVFVHGGWITPSCWDPFVSYFEARGYRCLAPAWPGKDRPIEAIREDPSPLAGVGVESIVDRYEQVIRELDEPPILIGHSFGGLFVQILLDRGLGAAGIAIDSAPPKGIFAFYPTSLISLGRILATPFGWRKVVHWSFPEFRFAFVHTMPLDVAHAIWDREIIPDSGRPFFEVGYSFLDGHSPAKVNFANRVRAPLLLIAGLADRAMPPGVARRTLRAYAASPARTDLKTFPDRTHWIIAQPGWEEVAQGCIDWIEAVEHVSAKQ